MNHHTTLPSLVTLHRQAALDAQSPIHPQAVAAASIRNARWAPSKVTGQWRSKLYSETPERARWRALFEAAADLPGVAMAVTYLKDSGESRTMLCRPLTADAEYTKRYALVYDLEAGYRRVNLDAIVKVTLETHSLED